MEFKVYILYSQTLDRYSVGYTGDTIDERLRKHNSSKKKGYTSTTENWKVLYIEPYHTKAEAMKRETEIKKKKSRKYIEMLVQSAPI